MAADEFGQQHTTKYLICGTIMQTYGSMPFTLSGTSSGWEASMIGRSEFNRLPLYLRVFVCPNCGHLQLFAYDAAKDTLKEAERREEKHKSFLKACVKCRQDIPIGSEECPYCGSKQPPSSKR
jgi:predicted RNA-binding Zn-ribbon protein involved in translation (DUF1610 family)